jgi:hypothetical protein
MEFSLGKNGYLWIILAACLFLEQEALALLSSATFTKNSRNCRIRPTSVNFRGELQAASGDEDNENISFHDETKLMMEAQQKKIDMLMDLLASQKTLDDRGSSAQEQVDVSQRQPQNSQLGSNDFLSSLPPLKVMLFIDGTWLYYSIHEREDEWCPIQQRFGKGWQFKYNFDWSRLPRVICQALLDQDKHRGWSATLGGAESTETNGHAATRPIETVRVSVFTSYKADTPKTSFRYKMFQDMLNAKYDVHMKETVGRGEKCVDIQLAVDMLHYATVPNAYDVALLLSGDKDFMPAMVRIREKGRRVGLVTMRRGCNRALVETPNIKDYDVIWLEDHLDELIQQRPDSEMRKRNPHVSQFTLMKIVYDFIRGSGMTRVSSRDIGKYIKLLMIGDRCVLEEVKQTYGGLYQFLIVSGIFAVEKVGKVKAFWVVMRENVDSKMTEEGKKTQFTADEKKFFEKYSLEFLEDKEKAYKHTLLDSTSSEALTNISMIAKHANTITVREELALDYSTYTVARLKEVCRERNLAVSGKKADLIERIADDVNEDGPHQPSSANDSVESTDHLEGLLLEYLHVKGGEASSRDVGRYLQANKASAKRLQDQPSRISALSELKELHGSIKKFVMQSTHFSVEEMESDDAYEFRICLKRELASS